MFQEPLLLRGTVAHNAGLGLALRGVGRAERELVLHQLKIAHLADRPERTPAPASPSFRRRRYSAGNLAQFTSFRSRRIGATTSRLQLC